MNQPKGHLFIVSGLTGGGKTTITQAALKNLSEKLPIFKVVTYTTRPPRPNEREGVDYGFVSESEFQSMKLHGDFLETTLYDGYWYGSPKAILSGCAAGKSFILVTDRAGAKTIKSLVPDAVLVWITVPSIEVLAERLRHRGTENSKATAQRLAIAAQEMDAESNETIYDHHIMNDNFQNAVNDLVRLIMQEVKVQQ